MNEITEAELWDAFYDTYDLEDSESKTSVLEELLTVSEARRYAPLSFSIRLEIVQSAVFSGFIDKALVAFTHCIAEFDAEEEYALSESFSVLWSSKWINRTIISFPSISKKQIHQIESDIADRFQKHGFGVRAHYMFCWLNAVETGDQERAEQLRKKWINEAYDSSHPACRACEEHYEILYQIQDKNFDKAVKKYQSLIVSRNACNKVPLTSHVIILPYLQDEKRKENAINSALFALQSPSVDHLSVVGEFIIHLLAENQVENAAKLVSDFLPHGLNTRELDQKLTFFLGVEQYLKMGHPLHFPFTHLSKQYQRDDLVTFLSERIDELGEAFDKRNQNTFITTQISAKRTP